MYYVISLSVQRTTHLIHPINSQVSLKHMKACRSSQEAGLKVSFNLQTAHDSCDEVGWVLSISVSLPLKSTRDPFHHRQVSPTSLDIGAQYQNSRISLSNRKKLPVTVPQHLAAEQKGKNSPSINIPASRW